MERKYSHSNISDLPTRRRSNLELPKPPIPERKKSADPIPAMNADSGAATPKRKQLPELPNASSFSSFTTAENISRTASDDQLLPAPIVIPEVKFHELAAQNKVEELKDLLARFSFSVNHRDSKGRTALIIAIVNRSFDVIKYLLNNVRDLDVNCAGSPFHNDRF